MFFRNDNVGKFTAAYAESIFWLPINLSSWTAIHNPGLFNFIFLNKYEIDTESIMQPAWLPYICL